MEMEIKAIENVTGIRGITVPDASELEVGEEPCPPSRIAVRAAQRKELRKVIRTFSCNTGLVPSLAFPEEDGFDSARRRYYPTDANYHLWFKLPDSPNVSVWYFSSDNLADLLLIISERCDVSNWN